jgi:arylsulfatase A-like enzyme
MHIDRRHFLKAAALTPVMKSFGGLGGADPSAAGTQRPNVVIIMADDMGFSDLGCFGSEIATPQLDRLAGNGLRFSNFYNTPRCCPSRAALLTGLYSHQAGVGHMVKDLGFPGYQGYLNDQCVTIAEVAKEAGYRTLMTGKWHVGEQRPHWPVDRGFEHYFGLIAGSDNYFRPERTMALDGAVWHPDKDSGFYMTDAFGAHAVDFIKEYGREPEPFLLYSPFTAPHWPLHAHPDDIARNRGKYKKGWDRLREERHERQIANKILDPRWKLTPRDPEVPAWEDVPNKDEWDLRMAVYAAQIERLDWNVGRMVDALRETGQLDNTLILFLADNGGCAEENIKGENTTAPGGPDSFTSYRRPWANASNTPFRLYKHWVHEGGISSPFIAHWPKRIRARGEIHHEPAHITDLMATVVEVTGATYPKTYQGRRIRPLAGKSVSKTFDGKPREGHDAIYWEHEGNKAIRQGDWKLVSRFPGTWELYNLREDRTELHNRAAGEPNTVAELSANWQTWADASNVVPWDLLQARAR